MDAVEVGGRNVDEALRRALDELGVERDEVEVEILSEGRPGLLGLGAEEARVRVTRRADRVAARRAPFEAERPAPSASSGQALQPAQGAEELAEQPAAVVDAEEAVDATEEILQDLLDRLGVDGHIVREPSLAGEVMLPAPLALLDIQGQNLSVLIGRRGETLSALQYLVNLLASRRLRTRVTVAVDVDSYRQRRAQLLQGLAQRMADRVRATGQPMTLEPMPAHERRLVHVALANQDDVMTQSQGEGEHRKVTISLRR
ncbi:MAG: protein jag [Chloroflexi bacterium]|nr:protein jag [Chloroflexota bacterium]